MPVKAALAMMGKIENVLRLAARAARRNDTSRRVRAALVSAGALLRDTV